MNYKEQIAAIKAQYNMPFERRQKAVEILTRLEEQEQMPQEEIMTYAAKIHPLIRGTKKFVSLSVANRNKPLFWARPAKIHNESFSFSTSLPFMKATGLTEVGRITTYHRYGGHYGCLRPSVDEAIIQCPKKWLDKVCAFEFRMMSDQFNLIYDYMLDRHVLTTVYYAGTLPDEVANLPIEW